MACVVSQCKNRSEKGNQEKGLRFYRFPKDPKQIVLWLKAARRGDLLKTGLSQHRRICNQHFVTGKYSLNPIHPDYVPSIFSYNKKKEYKCIKRRVQRFVRHEKRKEAAGAPFVSLFPPGEKKVLKFRLRKKLKTGQQQGQKQSSKPGQNQSPKSGLQTGKNSGQQQGQNSEQGLGPRADPQQSGPPGQQQQEVPKDVLVHLPGYLNGHIPGELFFRLPLVLLNDILRAHGPVQPQAALSDHEVQVIEEENIRPSKAIKIYQGDHNYSRFPESAPVQAELNESETPECEETQKSQESNNNERNAASQETDQSDSAVKDSQDKAEEPQEPVDHKKQLLCPVCDQVYFNVLRFASHVEQHVVQNAVKETKHICSVCDKSFNYNRDLKRHMNIHTGKKRFSCEYCDKGYSTAASLQSHLDLHLAGFDCTYCDMSLRSEDDLEIHLQRCQARADKEGPIVPPSWQIKFQCSDCDQIFPKESEVKEHQARVHAPDPQRPFSCSVCLQRFPTMDTAEEHLESHKKERAEKELSGENVELCDISVKFSGDQYLCNECGEMFYCKKSFKFHMRKFHIQGGPFRCFTCKIKFKCKQSLTQHLTLHKGENLYKFSCSVCQKKFRLKVSLDSHMLRHNGPKSFACTFCDARFFTKSALNTHADMHNEGQPFACTKCPKRFKRKKNLNGHMQERHGAGDHRCSYCKKTFINESGLHMHVNLKHIIPSINGDVTPKADRETMSAVDNIGKADSLVDGAGPGL